MKVGEHNFRVWCRKARQLWPLDLPVRVRRWTLAQRTMRNWGVAYSYSTETSYVIVIDASLEWDATLDSLIHEWAHLRRHDDTSEGWHRHDDAFWIEYGSMYRAWYREK